MLYYDFGLTAVFIVFMTKALDNTANLNTTIIAGVISFLTILFARVLTEKYFEERDPNKYSNLDRIPLNIRGHVIYLYYKAVFVIIANLVPIVLLIALG